MQPSALIPGCFHHPPKKTPTPFSSHFLLPPPAGATDLPPVPTPPVPTPPPIRACHLRGIVTWNSWRAPFAPRKVFKARSCRNVVRWFAHRDSAQRRRLYPQVPRHRPHQPKPRRTFSARVPGRSREVGSSATWLSSCHQTRWHPTTGFRHLRSILFMPSTLKKREKTMKSSLLVSDPSLKRAL